MLSQRVRRSVWLVGQLLDRPHQLILFQDLILVFAPFYHQLSNYGVQRDILLKSFSTQVMWPALPMATPQPPIQRTLQARPFLTTRSPLHHTIVLPCCVIPYQTAPYHNATKSLHAHQSHISPVQVSPAHAPQPLPAFPSKVELVNYFAILMPS